MTIQTILVTHHSHTDIGYTDHPQAVLRQHLGFIDRAIELAEDTADWPEPARFRWTCELSTVAERWLRERPTRWVDRFQDLHAQGRLAVAAMAYHWTPLLTPAAMARSLAPVRRLREGFGLSIRSAMQNDVNGAAWLWADLLPGAGISGLTVAPNPYRGIPPERDPDLFTWTGPGGGRLTTFLAPHYAHGVTRFGIGDLERGHELLAAELARLDAREGYRLPFLYLQATHPSRHDNGPPLESLSEFVLRWNEAGMGPPMEIATVDRLFAAIDDLPVDGAPSRSGDWPDGWADGVGSSAYETALARGTGRLLPLAESLAAASASGDPSLLDRAHELTALFSEHTWGSFASVVRPDSALTRALWNAKAGYAYEGWALAHELLADTGRDLVESLTGAPVRDTRVWRAPAPLDEASHRFLLVNPSSWTRTIALPLPADPARPRPRTITPALDGDDPAPLVEDDAPAVGDRYLTAELPPFGYRIVDFTTRVASKRVGRADELENDWFRIRIDAQTGGLASLYDKELATEWVADDPPWTFGQPVHETIATALGRKALFALDFDHRSYGELRRDAPLVREGTVGAELGAVEHGPLAASIAASLDLPFATAATIRWELPFDRKAVSVDYRFSLRIDDRPQAVYIPFPTPGDEARYHLDLNGVSVEVPRETLPGRIADWYAVQGWAALETNGATLVLATPDAPLVQLGGVRTGRWGDPPSEPFPGIVSWPLNNYWDTNFKATQEGLVRFRYSLTSSPRFDAVAAARFADETGLPAMAFPAPGASPAEGRLLSLGAEGTARVHLKRPVDGRGLIAMVHALSALDDALELAFPGRRVLEAWECSVLEEDGAALERRGEGVAVPSRGRSVTFARVMLDGPLVYRDTTGPLCGCPDPDSDG